MTLIDRVDARRRLATRLQHLRDDRVVVLGLPRGGAPVAYEAARDWFMSHLVAGRHAPSAP